MKLEGAKKSQETTTRLLLLLLLLLPLQGHSALQAASRMPSSTLLHVWNITCMIEVPGLKHPTRHSPMRTLTPAFSSDVQGYPVPELTAAAAS